MPEFLTLEDVLELHAGQIKSYGGSEGLRSTLRRGDWRGSPELDGSNAMSDTKNHDELTFVLSVGTAFNSDRRSADQNSSKSVDGPYQRREDLLRFRESDGFDSNVLPQRPR